MLNDSPSQGGVGKAMPLESDWMEANHGSLRQNLAQVRVVKADPKFKLIEPRGQSYYHTLRDKLGWAGQLLYGNRQT